MCVKGRHEWNVNKPVATADRDRSTHHVENGSKILGLSVLVLLE